MNTVPSEIEPLKQSAPRRLHLLPVRIMRKTLLAPLPVRHLPVGACDEPILEPDEPVASWRERITRPYGGFMRIRWAIRFE